MLFTLKRDHLLAIRHSLYTFRENLIASFEVLHIETKENNRNKNKNKRVTDTDSNDFSVIYKQSEFFKSEKKESSLQK